jgi:hypothetical protein
MVLSRSFLIGATLSLAGCSPVALQVQATPAMHAAPSKGLSPASVTQPLQLLPKKAEDLITDSEVSSTAKGHSYYDRHYQMPTWPQGDSGVTVGIGVDLGQQSEETTCEDWQGALAADIVERLRACAGIAGTKAKALAGTMRDIKIAWHPAIQEFDGFEVPNYWSLTRRTFPGFDDLRTNAQGALVSLVYNRGSSMAGPSRIDMRNLRIAVARIDYNAMAGDVRHMDVTMGNSWRNAGIYEGMAARREAEAALILEP